VLARSEEPFPRDRHDLDQARRTSCDHLRQAAGNREVWTPAGPVSGPQDQEISRCHLRPWAVVDSDRWSRSARLVWQDGGHERIAATSSRRWADPCANQLLGGVDRRSALPRSCFEGGPEGGVGFFRDLGYGLAGSPTATTRRGYLALPEGGTGPGVIVVQEWWGLDSGIKEMADRLAAAGFVALAPDLYHGELAGSHRDGQGGRVDELAAARPGGQAT
jgi:hypothetical protein